MRNFALLLPALLLAALLLGASSASTAFAADGAATPRATDEVRRFGRMPVDEIRRELIPRLTAADDNPIAGTVLETMWSGPEVATGDVVEAVAQSTALVDDRAAALVRLCSGLTDPWHVPQQAWLNEMSLDPWVRDQLRLYFGRWL